MHKKFRITVDGRSYDVTVEDLDQGAPPAPQPVAPVVPRPAAVPAAAPPPPAAVAPAAAAGPGAIVAPLGGVVFSIDVALGGTVAVGDKVMTIEAMKMKTEVMSKVAGKVTSIAVAAGANVETGQVLLTVG